MLSQQFYRCGKGGHHLIRWLLCAATVMAMMVLPYTLLSATGIWSHQSTAEPVASSEGEAATIPPVAQVAATSRYSASDWVLLPPELPVVESSFGDLIAENIIIPPPIIVSGGGAYLTMLEEGQYGLLQRMQRSERLVSERLIHEASTTILHRHHAQPSELLVALTFDDGPDPHYTPRVLSILKRYGAKATFFVIGEYAQRHGPLITRILAEGHEVGNHTFSHTATILSTEEEFWWEIHRTNQVLEDIAGITPRWFRPNDMVINTGMMRAAQQLGHEVVLWTIDALDWKAADADELLAHAVPPYLGSGAVILLHDGGGNRDIMLEALPLIIEELLLQGYRLATLSDLYAKRHFR